MNHEIVARPYSAIRFLSDPSITEVAPSRVDIFKNFWVLQIDNETIPSNLAKQVIELYEGELGNIGAIPDMFLHLRQIFNIEPLAPKVTIHRPDILLGNLNRDGFLRPIIVGEEGINYKRLKKDMYEVIRLSRAGVLEVGNLYLGYRINL